MILQCYNRAPETQYAGQSPAPELCMPQNAMRPEARVQKKKKAASDTGIHVHRESPSTCARALR